MIEQRLNQIITAERVQGDRLQELVSGVNQWFPVLNLQLETVQSEIQKSVAEATREILAAVKSSQSGAELTTVFLDKASRKVSGAPLSVCGCEYPSSTTTPYDTFRETAPNSICLSGVEKHEACISPKVERCITKSFERGYPPFRRICQ